MTISEEKEFQEGVRRIETLIQEIERFADQNAQAKAKELVQSLMDLHGAGLDRIMDIVSQAGETGSTIIDRFTRDDLVSNLLLLYGLHPLDLKARVLQALDKVRPYLNSHGGNVELLGVAEREGVVRLRLQGSCKSCPSSAVTLKLAIEEAIYEACPDVTAIEAEGVEQPSPSGTVHFKKNLRGEEKAPSATKEVSSIRLITSEGWEEVKGIESLPQGSVQTIEVSGRPVLFCRLGETFYAYSNICPNCDQTLNNAHLEATALGCPACGQHYDIVRAGNGLNQPSLHLEPFPLLTEGGRTKIALPVFEK